MILKAPKYAIVFGDKYTIEQVDKTSRYNEFPLNTPTFDGMLWVIVSEMRLETDVESTLEKLRQAVTKHVKQLMVSFMDEYTEAVKGQITEAETNKPKVFAVYKNMEGK